MSGICERMKTDKTLIGMVHCLPMPGTMNYGGDFDAVIKKAISDAETLRDAGFDAYIIEPMCDRPANPKRGALQFAAMTAVAARVAAEVKLPFGISYASPVVDELFAIALATGAGFVRVPTLVDAVIFSTNGCVTYPKASEVWDAKYRMRAEHIEVLADVQVKHARMLYSDIKIEQSAVLAQMQGASAVIVTGAETGDETPFEDLQRVARVVSIPVLSGSGVNSENIAKQLETASGVIIGSSIKKGGDLMNPVDFNMCRELAANARQ